jgi:hypothetical protein
MGGAAAFYLLFLLYTMTDRRPTICKATGHLQLMTPPLRLAAATDNPPQPQQTRPPSPPRPPPLRLSVATTTRPSKPSCLRLHPSLDLILRDRIWCTATNINDNRRLTDQLYFSFFWKMTLDAFFVVNSHLFFSFYFLFYLSVNDFLFNGKKNE